MSTSSRGNPLWSRFLSVMNFSIDKQKLLPYAQTERIMRGNLTMSTRIEIRHVAGSKVNQIEQFQLDNLDELTIGRDPRSTIAFDPARDDRVSRQHAKIRIIKGDQLAFRITDLGSSNGTRVNGNRIDRETDLLPGDRIELGSGGPVIVFDVQPRP